MTLKPSPWLAEFGFAKLFLALGLLASAALIPAGGAPAQAATLLERLEAPSATSVEEARHRRHHRKTWRDRYARAPLFCENEYVRRCGPYSCQIRPTRHCWR